MKTCLGLILLTVLFSCSDYNEKLSYFNKEYLRINEVSPETLCIMFLEKCNPNDKNSPFSNYSKEMIDRQCASFYRISSEDYAKLISRILIYKGYTKNNNLSIDKMNPIIDKVRANKKDELDEIILKSFDTAVKHKQKQLELENSLTLP